MLIVKAPHNRSTGASNLVTRGQVMCSGMARSTRARTNGRTQHDAKGDADMSTEPNTQPDLSILKTMVGIRNRLAEMTQKGKRPTEDDIMALLEEERESYQAHGGFRNKEKALGQIIKGFQSGAISIDDILSAMGINLKAKRKRAQGGLKNFFKRLFGK